MKVHATLLNLALLLGLTMVGTAQTTGSVRFDWKETKLPNGLRVITVEDHTAPVIGVSVTYNVGSRNERPGRTGFAHLFEHMMFQGSQNVGKGEHFNIIFNNGGRSNAATSPDSTNYFEVLPSNQLEAMLFLEADRMRGLDITQENLDNQRNVVQEERRGGFENVAYGKVWETWHSLMYDNFAYKHVTIGSMEDLNAASVEDVAAFFKTYYVPNNAVLTLVGDFRTADALARIKHHFGSIPRQPDPPAVDMTEPEQKAERRTSVDDVLARLPHVAIAFKTLPGNTPDYYALQLLGNILGGGSSSRLFQKLVRNKEIVNYINSSVEEMNGVGAFYILATLRSGNKTEDVEAAIYEELERLKKEPIADWELRKAKNNMRQGFISILQDSGNRAISIGQLTTIFGDPDLINKRIPRYTAVTKEDVQRVANKYLVQMNRSVVVTVPTAGTGSSSGVQQ